MKADGGLVIVPPSVSNTGQVYRILQGNWDNLGSLPCLKAPTQTKQNTTNYQLKAATESFVGEPNIPEGERNDFLFRQGLAWASQAKTNEELSEWVHEANLFNCNPPLLTPEVQSIINSILQYKSAGNILLPRQRSVLISAEVVKDYELSDGAFRLLSLIKLEHFTPNKSFAIGIDGLAKAMRKSRQTIRKARNELLTKGYIKQVKQGGSKPGDPHLYRLLRV